MSLETKSFYEFGAFRLNPEERRLLRGDRTVPLTPKAFEVLLALVESGGRVVGRNELMKRIWPGADMDEANLAVTISLLRKALGERPDGGLYIETVPRQGYRLAASVTAPSIEDKEAEGAHEDAIEKAAGSTGAVARKIVESELPTFERSERDAESESKSIVKPAASHKQRASLAARAARSKKAVAATITITIAAAVVAYLVLLNPSLGLIR